MAKKAPTLKTVETLKHGDAKRKNIPTAEHQSVLKQEESDPIRVAYERRNRDLDPQLVWRGKDEQDWSDLVIHAPPLYIQEKIHPKVLVDDLLARTKADKKATEAQIDLFADFNGVPEGADKTEFYQHDQHWSNRMILGDSLQVMASLAEREGLRGKVQCIYFDPPYGIKFNSNFQWSTGDRSPKKEGTDSITREPEQVKAFRDTWRDGIHSYLTYLRDRLTVARDLLTTSGSIFVQISDENLHLVRALLDEVLGAKNFVSVITFRKKEMSLGAKYIDSVSDYILWYAKDKPSLKYEPLYQDKDVEGDMHWDRIEMTDGTRRKLTPDEVRNHRLLPAGCRIYRLHGMSPARGINQTGLFSVKIGSRTYSPPKGSSWNTTEHGMKRLITAGRVEAYTQGDSLSSVIFLDDYPVMPLTNLWDDLSSPANPIYVVQTNFKAISRCILMTTSPGDLVLDPTCGSGTTAYVAEQWGRRWITMDTSRVALALARARIMAARYPFYLLGDSRDGQLKQGEISRIAPSTQPTYGNIKLGFVYERAAHVTLGSIANNTEIDVITEKWEARMKPLREKLNAAQDTPWQDWEVPQVPEIDWPNKTRELHSEWLRMRLERQKEIDASIAAKAEYENLYDRPYEDKKKVRVAGPFTVESLSPHRVLGVDENDELIDPLAVKEDKAGFNAERNFEQIILNNLKTAGVQQAHKEDRITFTSLTPWPGEYVCAEGRYQEGGAEKRAGIFIGPEFGTVARPDLVKAAREAGDAGFDVLIACAFNYEAHATEFSKLGRVPVLKARMNADLHMAEDLKNTGKGNLFVIFGEPDIDLITERDGRLRVKVNGVDVFKPQLGKVESSSTDEIACWFIDTDYNEESFFVRHAYFLGQNDPYGSLKTTLKAEINAEAWETLKSAISRPFDKPKSGRIAVKVINHLGDEVMKVFRA